jgi:hypothetical protein
LTPNNKEFDLKTHFCDPTLTLLFYSAAAAATSPASSISPSKNLPSSRRHDIQHNDTQYNNTQHIGLFMTLSINDIQHDAFRVIMLSVMITLTLC